VLEHCEQSLEQYGQPQFGPPRSAVVFGYRSSPWASATAATSGVRSAATAN